MQRFYVFVCVCMYVFVCVCVYMHIYRVCIWIYIYINLAIYIYIYTYIYIHTHSHVKKLGHPIELSGPRKVLKFGNKASDEQYHMAYHTVSLFDYNKAKSEKPCVIKLGHPMIQLPVDPLLAAITWSNNFLYDFISLSHRSGGILAHSSLQRCSSLLRFEGICLYTALTIWFQSGWGLDYDWAIAEPWLISSAILL